MKYEWRKTDKNLYLPPQTPTVIEIPKFQFIMIDGEGDPNGETFSQKIEVLFSLSYGVKMAPKKNIEIEGYFDYTVFPLEGVWSFKDASEQAQKLGKENFKYTIMIRQPDFVTQELFDKIKLLTDKKINNPYLKEARLLTMKEGLCVQMMHIGSFDDEPKSFALMQDFCQNNGYERIGKEHREIYLSDFRKTEKEDLQTVLRFPVFPLSNILQSVNTCV